ncbi:MAG: hypothetical protein IJD22_01385 [Clostridia bacterium]|nr:hypothetical protein [Clostridia bacterium]
MNRTIRERKSLGKGFSLISGYALSLAGLFGMGIGARIKDLSIDKEMVFATAAIGMRAASAIAIPIFASLICREFENKKIKGKLLLALLFIALVCELPYDMLNSGMPFDAKGSNPVFGVLLSLIILWSTDRYKSSYAKGKLICICTSAAALFWAATLRICGGWAFVLLTAASSLLKNNSLLLPLSYAAILSAGSLISPYYILAPIGALAAAGHHTCDTSKGLLQKSLPTYPAMLIIIAVFFSFFK